MISITGSSASQAGYYYFYYNINVEVQCFDVASIESSVSQIEKQIIKVIDILGRETIQTNQPLFYIYDDGTVEKKIIID